MFLKWLETFCILSENRSFSNTARELFVTQPSISNQISKLEEELGIILIDRTTKRIQPTKAGKLLYFYANKVLKDVDTLKNVINEYKGLNIGEITIGTSTLPGEYIFPKIFLNFNKQYPTIKLNIVIKDTFKILEKIKEGLIEIGIVGSKTDDVELKFEKFLDDNILLVGKNKIPNGLDIKELQNKAFVTREDGSGTIFTVKNVLKNKGVNYENFNFIAKVASLNGLKEMVKSGIGMAFISKFAVEEELNKGLLHSIEIKDVTPVKRSFYIVTSEYFSLSPASEKMKEFIVNF